MTGTSLTTFMLCSVELMLAGLSINIPMLRPFYIRFRAKYSKSSSAGRSGSYNKASGSRQLQLGDGRVTPANYQAWIELVRTTPLRRFLFLVIAFLTLNRPIRIRR